jgi:DHA1 family multidrug resistance protein-like MFS transporter
MKRRLSPFVLLCVMGGLAILSSTMSKNPALPLFIRSLNVPAATVGSIPAGILSDVIGRRKVLLMSMVVFSTAPFLYLLVQSPWQLVWVRVYHGLATAILGPVAMATVADLFDAGRGERMAWYSSATMVGRFIAPTLGGALIIGTDYRWVYLATGVAGVLALLAALRLPRIDKAADVPAGTLAGATMQARWSTVKDDLKVLFRNGALLGTSLIEAAQYFSFGFVEVFLPLYLNEQLGLKAWQIGPLFTAQIVVTALSKPITGRYSDRIGRVPMIAAGLLTCAVSMVLMPQTATYAVLFVLVALFGLGLATVTAATAAMVADLSRATTHGAALGTLSSIMDVGQSAGPMLGGLMIAAFGYRTAFGTVGVALALATALYVWRVQAIKARPAGATAT